MSASVLRSMTGFGSATVEAGETSVAVEVRSVNSRHLRVEVDVPRGGEAWEPALRDLVGERLERGRVDLSVAVEGGQETVVELDEERVEAYLRAFGRLREEYDVPGRPDLSLLVRCGGLLRERRSAGAEEVEAGAVEEAARRALDALVEMREEEGARLEEDLRQRLDGIARGLDRVEELAPRRLERERERLREAAAELTGDAEVEEERLAQEIALLADKWDVGEEVVRARAHVEAFRDLLGSPAEEAVGKRLKFLVQEMHREINTTGAKANDADISREVVEMKNEVERLREQIENVE